MFKRENEVVDEVQEAIDLDSISSLQEIYKRVNLASRNFEELWSKWWEGSPPPNLEVDLIPVFKHLDEVNLIAIEVKYFKPGSKLRFSEGLGQAMSYSLFGFDCVVLWHIFDENVGDSEVENSAKALQSLRDAFDLPIFCLVTKIDNCEEMSLYHFRLGKYGPDKPTYYLRWINKQVKNNRNPMLDENNIQRRRKVLKTLLGIPL